MTVRADRVRPGDIVCPENYREFECRSVTTYAHFVDIFEAMPEHIDDQTILAPSYCCHPLANMSIRRPVS
jgi:hypothetical protein